MIAKSTIDKVFDNTDIYSIVSEFVSLKRNGSNYKACCPFHNENTPSFVVSPSKGIYKCFGCGKSGNKVGFVMEHERFTYPEAIKWICEKFDLPFEEEISEEERKKRQVSENLYSIHESVCLHFQSKDISYWIDRGYNAETINKFRLGFASDDINTLNFDRKLMEQASLLNSKGNDFFRNRATVPIFTLSGKVCGFGGRIIKENKKAPKYLNSRNTEIYNKSKDVYGLYHAKDSIVKLNECYIVEGYTDVISMAQGGIENVVSSSGTSLTKGQLSMIGRFSKNITFLLDGDVAGLKAIEKGIQIALEEDFDVKVVILPNKQDPDSMVAKGGFKEYLRDNKKDFLVFKTDQNKRQYTSEPSKRTEKIKEVVELLRLITDGIKKSVYIKESARLFGISEQMFSEYVNKGQVSKSKTPVQTQKLNNHYEELARVMIEYGWMLDDKGPFIKVIMGSVEPYVKLDNELLKNINNAYFEMEMTEEYKNTDWFVSNIKGCSEVLLNTPTLSSKKQIKSLTEDIHYIIRDCKDVVNNYLRIELPKVIESMVVETPEDFDKMNELMKTLNSL